MLTSKYVTGIAVLARQQQSLGTTGLGPIWCKSSCPPTPTPTLFWLFHFTPNLSTICNWKSDNQFTTGWKTWRQTLSQWQLIILIIINLKAFFLLFQAMSDNRWVPFKHVHIKNTGNSLALTTNSSLRKSGVINEKKGFVQPKMESSNLPGSHWTPSRCLNRHHIAQRLQTSDSVEIQVT